MALVQQKIGTLPVELHAIARLIDDLANIPYAGGYRIELLKSRRSRMRNDGGQRRFSDAGRAEKDTGGQPVRFYGAAQQHSLAYNVLLPQKFIQRLRPHSIGKRRNFLLVDGEKIHFSALRFLRFLRRTIRTEHEQPLPKEGHDTQ